MNSRPGLLLVANWDSGVGYAWWLMESFWATLARAYSPTHRVLVAFPSISTLSPELTSAPLEAVEEDFGARGPAAFWRQIRFLRAHRIRVLYLSDRGTVSLRHLAFRLLGGVRLIVTHDHTPGLRTRPRGLKRAAKALLHRIPGLAVDGAIGASEFVRERLIDVVRMPPERCFAAPNGLPPEDTDTLSVDVRNEFGFGPEQKILVMTGRANRYKNVEFVLEVLARLTPAEQAALRFLFVGDGPDLEHFRHRAAALNLAPLCTFAGRRSDVPAILRGCDLAIHPSRGEVGYSLSILESMRAGLPVLVPDNPSVCAATRDGETGLIYREDDPEDALKVLRCLLRDPATARHIGEAARNEVATRYRLEDTHRALLAAFQAIDPEFPATGGPVGN